MNHDNHDDSPWLGVNAAGELALRGPGGDVSGGSPPVGEWVHVAFAWSGSQGQLYLNGQAVGPVFTAATGMGNALGIGYRQGQPPWLGDIDDVVIYKRGLDAAAIEALYRSAETGAAVSL